MGFTDEAQENMAEMRKQADELISEYHG